MFFPSALFILFKEQRKQRLEVQPALAGLESGQPWLCPCWPGVSSGSPKRGHGGHCGCPQPPEGSRRTCQGHEWLRRGSCVVPPRGLFHPCPSGKGPKKQIVPLPPGTGLASDCSSQSPTSNPFSQRLIPHFLQAVSGHGAAAGCCGVGDRCATK